MNTMEEYRAFLAQVRQETDIEAFTADDDGLVSLDIDGRYTLSLQFVEPTGKVLCFVELVQLPADASKAVYRDLLAGALFGKDTAGGYFALEPETETVVYNYVFELDQIAKDVDGFTTTLDQILRLCDIWRLRIEQGGESPEGDETASPPDTHIIHV